MNTYLTIAIVFPLVSLIIGVLGFHYFKNVITAPIIVAVISTLLMVSHYNVSFVIWIIIYTVLAFASSYLFQFVQKKGA